MTAIVGPEFDVGEVANDVDTLAGYVATRIGRVPVRGEIIPGPGKLELEVLDADPRRVKKLKISPILDGKAARETPRRPPSNLPPASTPLPVTRDASVKLSPDEAPSKVPRPQ